MKTRLLKHGVCELTQEYRIGNHNGIDIVKEGYMLDYVLAHSDGVVVEVIDNCKSNTPNDKNNLGNMINIEHGNGYFTRYLHLQYNSLKVKVGDKVKKGQIIGYMGNTGYSFGGHLHFEIWKGNNRINPIEFLDKDLPIINSDVNVYYKVKTQKHGWLPEVKNLEDYAGFENSPIIAFAVKVDKGSIRYRAHIKNKGWLPYVNGYNINDFKNGYAGNDEIIDAMEIYYYTPSNIRPYKKAKYKVNNYGWQYDNERIDSQDGYAGIFGINVTKLQVIIE